MKEMLKEIFTDEEIEMIRSSILLERHSFFTFKIVSCVLDNFPVRSIKIFKMDECFPSIYLNNYIYSLSDYKDKTLLAILYAVQNGFPIKDLTRVYKEKMKKLLEGGYKVKFSTKSACDIVRKTIFYYFIKNPKIRWL